MKGYSRNRIKVYGDKNIQATHREVIRRLSEDHPFFSRQAIGEVFYGLAGDAAILGKKQTSADWVWFSNEYGDGSDDLTLDSGGNTPDQLLNHIAWFYSKVDPDCVLHNWYTHDLAHYFGSSYRRVKNNKIFNIERHIFVEEDVCSEDELDDRRALGEDVISWEELHERHFELDLELKNEFLREFPEVSHYLINA
jgi:hypothetical protein